MINSNKLFYHQEQKSAQNERFAINDDKSFYHWYVNLLADTKILKYISQYLIRCDLSRDFPEIMQAFPNVL